MERRTFLGVIAGSLLAAPLAAEAQQSRRVYRIGMLERTSQAINAANLDGFRRRLRELGYVEDKNFVIDYRSADGRDERFPALATELVRLKVDLIVARGTPAILAAKNATSTIPVISVGVGDPVAVGFVASLAHPGGNVTGLSPMVAETFSNASRSSERWFQEPRESRDSSIWAIQASCFNNKRPRRRLGLWVCRPSFSTCGSRRIWHLPSPPQSGSVPMDSSWGTRPSHRQPATYRRARGKASATGHLRKHRV
jgi:ABC transporter substrate binding protein